MPLARIITRAVEESQELAAELRGRGYEVEILSPSETAKTRADVELRLEECTPEEALIRASVLPETNDMAVFIAPGAISGARVTSSGPSLVPDTSHSVVSAAILKMLRDEPQYEPRKWYQLTPETNVPTDQAMNLSLAALEELAASVAANASLESDDIESLIDRDDEPIFAGIAPLALDVPPQVSQPVVPKAPLVVAEPTTPAPATIEAVSIPAPVVVAVPRPVATPPEVRRAAVAAATPESPQEIFVAPHVGASAGAMRAPTVPVAARVRLSLPITRTFWKGALSFACVAALVVVMGAWVRRNAPVPAGFGSWQHEATVVPAAPARAVAPPSAGKKVKIPSQAANGHSEPASSPSLVPQAAAAVVPQEKPDAAANAGARKAPQGDQLIAEDTVRRFAPPKPKAKAKAKPAANDGIKRYSDLD